MCPRHPSEKTPLLSLALPRRWAEGTAFRAMQSSFPEVITDSTSLPPGKAQAWIKVIDGSGIPVTLWSGDVIRHVGLVQFDVLTTSEAHGRRIVEFVGNVLDAQEIELWDGSGDS